MQAYAGCGHTFRAPGSRGDAREVSEDELVRPWRRRQAAALSPARPRIPGPPPRATARRCRRMQDQPSHAIRGQGSRRDPPARSRRRRPAEAGDRGRVLPLGEDCERRVPERSTSTGPGTPRRPVSSPRSLHSRRRALRDLPCKVNEAAHRGVTKFIVSEDHDRAATDATLSQLCRRTSRSTAGRRRAVPAEQLDAVSTTLVRAPRQQAVGTWRVVNRRRSSGGPAASDRESLAPALELSATSRLPRSLKRAETVPESPRHVDTLGVTDRCARLLGSR